MAPSELLLQLFQLHPFLLPFTDWHMLMPATSNQILAISANTYRLSVKLSAVHLLSCHRVNQVYLCERNGVLKQNLNDTCLGSLYMQDLRAPWLCVRWTSSQRQTPFCNFTTIGISSTHRNPWLTKLTVTILPSPKSSSAAVPILYMFPLPSGSILICTCLFLTLQYNWIL